MSRYIDADSLKQKWLFHGKDGKPYCDEIDAMPTADVVEVVRCRDCMWNYIHVTPKGHDYHICRLMNLAFDNNDDFFCAYGEKRNECGEPIPHWRGQMDGCLPFQTEVNDEQIH